MSDRRGPQFVTWMSRTRQFSWQNFVEIYQILTKLWRCVPIATLMVKGLKNLFQWCENVPVLTRNVCQRATLTTALWRTFVKIGKFVVPHFCTFSRGTQQQTFFDKTRKVRSTIFSWVYNKSLWNFAYFLILARLIERWGLILSGCKSRLLYIMLAFFRAF